jgi:ABC-type sugar transport system ATPase subunit
MTAAQPRLSVRDLSVSFGAHRALDSLTLDIQPGRILGLLGANGSGKSTTVKALTGINPVEPGAQLALDGAPLSTATLTPGEAQRRGIRVVHQEAPLVAALTVAESMAMQLGFPTVGGVLRSNQMIADAQRRLDMFDVDIDPRQLCSTLSPAERALVSLAIALADIAEDKALLILDEATASLSTDDARRFLEHVSEATTRGLAVLMVTHRLPEVAEFCDDIVVLRDGHRVATFDRESFDERDIVHAMVGEASTPARAATSSAGGPSAVTSLRVRGLTGGPVRNAGFTAERGSIIGFAGRAGGGASDVLRLIAGVTPMDRGEIEVLDRPVRVRHPKDAVDAGIFYISSDRLTEGGVLTLSVLDNLTLPRAERYGVRTGRRLADAERMVQALDIRPGDVSAPLSTLSGGNQQKVLLARWLLLDPTILLLDDPTVGVDPHTREVMFDTFRALAETGCTLLFRSTEPEQLARLCDRVLVIRDGMIADELTGARLTTEEVSLATFI